MHHSKRFLKLVKETKKRVKETTVKKVMRMMDGSDEFVLVDCREESEWARGHLPGAIHLGKGVIERDIETTVPDNHAPIVIYCGGGYRSALAAANLQRMGYTNVMSMDGGWRGWKKARYRTVKK